MGTRLVIADDHVAIRQMLALLLEREARYLVVGEARTGIETLSVCEKQRPDLLILDLSLPELCGVEVLRRVRTFSKTRVLLFSGSTDRALILRALRCRPHGYVGKADPVCALRAAIAAVASGTTYFTPSVAPLVHDAGMPEQATDTLSKRETEILQMIAEGLSSKEIADRLSVALKTIENHRTNLMQKLALHNVASLTRYAVRRGLVA